MKTKRPDNKANIHIARRLFARLATPRTHTQHTPADFRAIRESYRAEPDDDLADDADDQLDAMLRDSLDDE